MNKDRKVPGNYEVGYRKPPRHTRFKPNQSGNPKGRSLKSRNLKTDLVNELGGSIRVREGDREFKISKQEAFLKSLVGRSLQGDARASGLVVSLMARLLDLASSAPDDTANAEEQAIIDAYIARRLQSENAAEAPEKMTESAKSGAIIDPSVIVSPKTEQSTDQTRRPPDVLYPKDNGE